MATRRRLIIIGSVLITAVIGIIVFMLINSYKQSEAFATNIRFADSQNDKVKFFTGSNFAELNVASGKTSSLSPILFLPAVTEVEWGKDAVLVNATDNTPIDDLYPILQAANKPTDTSYWWLYNFKTNKYQLIQDPQYKRSANDVQWVNDNEYVYMVLPVGETDSAEKIYTDFYKRDANGKESKLLSYDAKNNDEVVNIISVNSKEIFVLINSDDGLRLSKLDISTGEESIIEKDINREAAVSPDGNTFIISKLNTKNENNSEVSTLSDIYYINGETRKKVATGMNAVSRWNKKSNSFITYGEDGKGNNKVIFTSSEFNKQVDLEKSVDKGLTLNSVLVNNDTNDLLLINEDSNIFHYSKKSYNNTPSLQNDEALHGDFYESGFNINYFPQEKRYNVYITDNPFSKNSQKALDFIKEKNLDPNQLNLKWYVYDDVNRGS